MKRKLLALALMAGGTMFAQTRFSVGVNVGGYGAPVAYRSYQPPCPGPGYVWINGYWANQGYRNVWVNGFWRAPEYRGVERFAAGHDRDDRYRFGDRDDRYRGDRDDRYRGGDRDDRGRR